MVSIRRIKERISGEGDEKMVQDGLRRSSRLLALERQNNLKDKKILLPMNIAQTSLTRKATTRKRVRRKKVQDVYEGGQTMDGTSNADGSFIIPSSPQSMLDKIIGYILDLLEVKDEHELFSMPDNIEAYNYAESLSNPGDFATLRQKHLDGMYKTLEQFESDVYMVLCKAIDSNSSHSVPYREAQLLQEQAKQVFRSLRNNPTYAELELSTWHQNYFNYGKNTVRQTMTTIPDNTAQAESGTHQEIPRNIRQNDTAFKVASIGRARLGSKPQPRSSSSLRGRRVVSQDFQHSKFCTENRRYTNQSEADSEEQIVTMVSNKPVHLVYNDSAPSYKESLMHFVKKAGPIAKVVAERRCRELDLLVQAQSMYAQWRLSTPSGIAQFTLPFIDWPIHASLVADTGNTTCTRTQWPPYNQATNAPMSIGYSFAGDLHAPTSSNLNMSDPSTSCKVNSDPFTCSSFQLETDELLALFCQIVTHVTLPASINNTKSSSNQAIESQLGFDALLCGGNQAVTGVGVRSAGVKVMNETGQCLTQEAASSQPVFDLSFWQARLSASKASGQKMLVGPEVDQGLATRLQSLT